MMKEYELPTSADDFLNSVLLRMHELGVDLDFFRKPFTLRLPGPSGYMFNYESDGALWAYRQRSAACDALITAEYTTGMRGLNLTASALLAATTDEEIAAVFSLAFLQAHTSHRTLPDGWRGDTFRLLEGIRRLLFAFHPLRYHHSSTSVLPVSIVNYDTRRPTYYYDVADLIAVDAALNIGAFALVRIECGEVETTHKPALKIVQSDVEVKP